MSVSSDDLASSNRCCAINEQTGVCTGKRDIRYYVRCGIPVFWRLATIRLVLSDPGDAMSLPFLHKEYHKTDMPMFSQGHVSPLSFSSLFSVGLLIPRSSASCFLLIMRLLYSAYPFWNASSSIFFFSFIFSFLLSYCNAFSLTLQNVLTFKFSYCI